jgi:hypothetical protein
MSITLDSTRRNTRLPVPKHISGVAAAGLTVTWTKKPFPRMCRFWAEVRQTGRRSRAAVAYSDGVVFHDTARPGMGVALR